MFLILTKSICSSIIKSRCRDSIVIEFYRNSFWNQFGTSPYAQSVTACFIIKPAPRLSENNLPNDDGLTILFLNLESLSLSSKANIILLNLSDEIFHPLLTQTHVAYALLADFQRHCLQRQNSIVFLQRSCDI